MKISSLKNKEKIRTSKINYFVSFIYFVCFVLVSCLTSFGQSTLKMGSVRGSESSEPTTSSKTVTLYENVTTAFSPIVAATYTSSNYQSSSETVVDPLQPELAFGGFRNGNVESMKNTDYYPFDKALNSAKLMADCGLDLFFINDQSGSVDAIENKQSRQFITEMGTRVNGLGTGSNESRFTISEFADANTWYRYSFPSVGTNYTTSLGDIIQYENAARTLSGWTSIYRAMVEAKTAVETTVVSGRNVPKVIVLMTDAYCFQIEGAALSIAQELKNKGYYLVILAIDAASSCTQLPAMASPGGYFSAGDYQTLENNAITFVENIYTAACNNAPNPTLVYDLTTNITSFTATGCTPGPGTYTANYTISNSGNADFNANLKVAFYDGDPTLPTSNHLITQDVGSQSISENGMYNGTLTNTALATTNTLYAVVNINGSLAGNAVPLSYPLISTQLNENTEEETSNNFSTGISRSDQGTCAPQAKIDIDVTNSGLLCDDKVLYEVTICNNGNAKADIGYVAYPPTDFSLSNINFNGNLSNEFTLEWDKTLGGSLNDYNPRAAMSSDGGILLGSISRSDVSGDKTVACFFF